MFSGSSRQDPEHFSAASRNKKIVLWGYFETSVLKAISQYADIDCIIDNDSELWGMKCCGVKVYPAEHLYALRPQTHVVLYTGRPGAAYSSTRAILAVDDFEIYYYNVISDKFFRYFSGELFDNLDRIKMSRLCCQTTARKGYTASCYFHISQPCRLLAAVRADTSVLS